VAPSDKGGDLCVIRKRDYESDISEHLQNNRMYRKVTVSKIKTLENKINTIWKKVRERNKISKKVQNMAAQILKIFRPQ
jgi:hypothetical protein